MQQLGARSRLILSALFLLLAGTVELCCSQQPSAYPIDLLEPIVRISPARREGGTLDRFGYSAVPHRLQEVYGNDSYLEALSKTVLMVGAPDGRFPGGIGNIELSPFACLDDFPMYTEEQLRNNSAENISRCYDDIVPGLIYTCGLSSGDCGATIGNGNATSPDGLLFDRVGNLIRPDYENGVSNSADMIHQNKSGQLMGATMFSIGDYFVACAPLWEYAGNAGNPEPESEPLGQCVYSTRNLSGFALVQPCLPAIEGSNNQNSENFCALGSSIYISRNNSNPLLAAGSPTRQFSSGGVYYYDDLSTFSDLVLGEEKPVYVPASHASNPTIRTGYLNVDSDETQTYYGFAITSGFITRQDYEDFIVSAPRWEENYHQFGRVFIITELNEIASVYVQGEQFGEYFGNAIATADLNNDGWDDLIVGAPIYSKASMPEMGRIFIYKNNQGTLNRTDIIEGFAEKGRFGYAIEALGDVNDDGYEDFAVSAPYEGSGVVYIYYGQEEDIAGSIVDTEYAQRIDGATFAERVSNITEVSTFGFSLSGEVDVDNNQYNDLVVGAHGSQAVFVLRTRPIATVNISASVDSSQTISLIRYTCIDPSNNPSSCFNVTVCAYYYGKSLDNGFTTNYTLSENIIDSQKRLFFRNYIDTSVTQSLTFTAPNMESCDDVTVYILNETITFGFDDFELNVEVEQVTRPDIVVNTNFQPSDLSLSPEIVSEPFDFSVPVDSQCGADNVCDLDLILTYINTTFLGLDGDEFSEQSFLTLDAVERVDISLSFANRGEDVFGYMIRFPLLRSVFEHRLVLPQSSFFSCNDTTPRNTTFANYVCTDQRPYLRMSDGAISIRLRWLVNRELRDSNRNVQIPITISADPSDDRNREANLTNNEFTVNIDIRSRAQYQATLSFAPDFTTYQGNHTPSDSITDASGLGEELHLTAGITNNGPSTIYNAILTVYIPAQLTSVTGERYFYYPAAVQTTSGEVSCDTSVLNPNRFRNVTSSNNNRRRRRSVVTRNRSFLPTSIGLKRQLRQDTASEYSLDCMRDRTSCIALRCNITDLIGTASIDITGFADERFYNNKEEVFMLNALAVVSVSDSFIDTSGSTSNSTDSLTLNPPTPSPDTSIPWYYIAPPAAGGVIIIVIIIVILYFVGFFSRKKRDEENVEDEGGVPDQFVENPFGDK